MHRQGNVYNLAGFLGLVAALFLAFGPAMAPALSASPKNNYIEICTSFGLVKKAVAGDYVTPGQQSGNKHTDKNSNHCLFCNLRELAFSLPPMPGLALPAGFFLSLPVPQEIGPSAGLVLLPYNPRAPPFSLS